MVGDKVELVPKPVELFLSFGVEDQFAKSRVVPVVPHRIVITGAEEAATVLGIIGPVAAPFRDVEVVRENGSESLECGLVLFSLRRGYDQVFVTGPGPAIRMAQRGAAS